MITDYEPLDRYSISNPRGCTCVQSHRIVYTIPLNAEIDQITVVSHHVHKLLWCREPGFNLVYYRLYTTQKMFVSKIAEVDFFLSQINVLLSKVNEKFDECPDNSRSVILPRIHHIVSELEWMMSLSTKGSQSEDEEDGNCTYSGALSPPLSSRSSDVESLTWDNQDFYKLYYEDDADDEEEEDYDEEKSENDDHGPIQFSTSSLIESSNDNVNIEAKKCDEVAENEIQIGEAAHVGEDADDEKKFISMMSATIQKLAPGSTYHVTRPRQYRVDLSQVNSRFLGNIPRP